MPRLARKNLETCFFHIIVQGINREYIFKKDEDIEKYLFLIKKYSSIHKVKIIAYCIMNNHAHFLIYTENIDGMSKTMQRVNTTYAKYYNRKEKRVGYLFRNRYISQAIRDEAQLFRCIVYIHRNPVEAKITDEMEGYKHSTYNNYKNNRIDYDILKLVFGSSKKYLETFLEIHRCSDIQGIIDIEPSYTTYEDVIKKYRGKVIIEELSYKDDMLKQIVSSLSDDAGLSLREIAIKLGKNKDILSKIMRK